MGLFKKKENVPKIQTATLPPLPSLPPIAEDSARKEMPELPSFPSSSKNEDINQEIVKSAVSDLTFPTKEEPKTNPQENLIQTNKTTQSIQQPSITQELKLPDPITPSTHNIAEEKLTAPVVPTHLSESKSVQQKQNDPIFVRIDKFQSAQKNFEEIKSKMAEMESVLNKIKDVKSKEEEELKGWSEDIEKLKTRLSEIDNDIFSQL